MSRNLLLCTLLWCNISMFLRLTTGRHLQKTLGSVPDFLSHLIFGEKCMDELGCFSNGPPFFDITERPLSLLPERREQIHTTFRIFTRKNPSVSENVTNVNVNNGTIRVFKFDPRLHTKFIIPGFISKLAPEWVNPLKDALLEKEDLNVCIVDWTGGDGPLYEQAVANTRVVGAEVATFIKFLENTENIKPETVHLIGHSLGAHIAGYAGKRTPNLGRITGLDPAGPYFENVSPVVRLNRTDAVLVDVIHTNAATSRFTGFGTTESIGDYDFFPNGGYLQPGCPDIGSAILSFFKNPLKFTEAFDEISCNHQRSIDLYMATLHEEGCRLAGVICPNQQDFESGKCGHCGNQTVQCVAMSEVAERPLLPPNEKSLNIYLKTTSERPYCAKDL